MALKITQKVTSRQLEILPKQLNRAEGVSATGRQLQSRATPTIPASVDPKVRSTVGTENLVKGRSIAPLISPDAQFEVNGFRLSEKVHEWGGYSVVFLDLHPVLDATFAGLNKWIFAASGGRWKIDQNRIHDYRRWIISIDGINQ